MYAQTSPSTWSDAPRWVVRELGERDAGACVAVIAPWFFPGALDSVVRSSTTPFRGVCRSPVRRLRALGQQVTSRIVRCNLHGTAARVHGWANVKRTVRAMQICADPSSGVARLGGARGIP